MPKFLPQEKKDAAVELALKTSQSFASQKMGVSTSVIRSEYRRRGLKARRLGNFTNEEVQMLAPMLVR